MAREVRAREFTVQGDCAGPAIPGGGAPESEGTQDSANENCCGERSTRVPFRGDLTVQQRWHAFRSRREIGEYLAPRLEPFRTWIADRTSFWSWLGMFHFEDTVRIVDGAVRLSPLDETFVIDRNDKQNLRGIHRHCLRSAWQLCEVHGEDAAFLLDQLPWARGFIADRVFQSQTDFQLCGDRPADPGTLHRWRPPEARVPRSGRRVTTHLLRVLDQLERTYDVYGMTPEALVRVLPSEFEPWVNGASPQPDQKLHKWEATVQKNGHGTMRYKGFRATVRIDEANALEGTIVNPKGQPIGTASAAAANEFVRAMRRRVNEYLTRQ